MRIVPLILLISFPAAADDCRVVALVTRVLDGDTVEAAGVGRVRLLGIDAPEMGGPFERPGPFALEARESLQALVLHRWVRFECDGTAVVQALNWICKSVLRRLTALLEGATPINCSATSPTFAVLSPATISCRKPSSTAGSYRA